MANLPTLKSLVHTLADTFISRNNDVSGYWAMGMLDREALESSQTVLEIELYGAREEPGGSVAAAVAGAYEKKLIEWVASRRVNLLRAVVVAKFGSHNPPVQGAGFHFEEPFDLHFSLVDANGRKAVAQRSGWCRPHNALWELRRERWAYGSNID